MSLSGEPRENFLALAYAMDDDTPPQDHTPEPRKAGAELDFDQFALREDADTMLTELAEQRFAWEPIAIQGQLTTLYGGPNLGKTLTALNGISRQIRAGQIDGSAVFYINADDNARGIAEKQSIAQEFGFLQLVPGRNGFNPPLLAQILRQRAAERRAEGCVVIVDTLKKFTDLMDKRAASDWGAVARMFVAAGGTLIGLAHVNKHKDADGRSVYAGTTDIADDSDCVFILELQESTSERRTVLLRNTKARGEVAEEVMLTYVNQGSYRERFDSVTSVGDEDREQIMAERRHQDMVAVDQEHIDAIREQINSGATLRTEIIKAATAVEGLTRRRLFQVLDRYTGRNPQWHFWQATPGEKNARHYTLLKTGQFGQFGKTGQEGD